jgi:transcription antitermination factor NusB
MKGRRQARRSALQALYELDQSSHPVETVLAARLDALGDAALDSALGGAQRALGRQVVAGWDGRPLDEAPVAVLAERLGAARADVAAVARVLNQAAPQADYFLALTRGVLSHRERLDARIGRLAPEWPVTQMAPVDRNVLRIALWELATGASPPRVAINEAVELARAFSGEGARRMVNGALGAYVASGVPLVLPEAANGDGREQPR